MPKLDETSFNIYIQTLAEAVQDWKEGEDHYLEIVFSEKAESIVKKYLEKAPLVQMFDTIAGARL
jgi:hypothetical protein